MQTDSDATLVAAEGNVGCINGPGGLFQITALVNGRRGQTSNFLSPIFSPLTSTALYPSLGKRVTPLTSRETQSPKAPVI